MAKALIIIDMIRAYSKDIYSNKRLVSNQLHIIQAFQKKSFPVIVAIPGSKNKTKNPIMLHLWGDELEGDETRKKGHKRGDLIPELQKIAWNKIIKKPEYSAFFQTDLEAYCKRKHINELYFCGIYSGVCVHYSAIDAAYRRIWPYLVVDGSTTSQTSWHKANCKRFAQTVGKTITTKQLLNALE